MNIGILGSGVVGQQLGFGFLQSGHEVTLGTRNPDKLKEWINQTKQKGKAGSFSEAASFGDVIVLAVSWNGLENVIHLAGVDNFRNKIVIDVTNPLLIKKEDECPELAVGYPNSGGAIIQSWLPEAKIVKAFNIITAFYMCKPRLEQGTADLFIAGNEKQAKETVKGFAAQWGWRISDIGDINQSYLLESLAMLWIRFGFLNNHWTHAFNLLMK